MNLRAEAQDQVKAVEIALSTHRFDKHVDSMFDISMQEQDLIKIFVENVCALPNTKGEMERRYPGATAEIGSTIESILRLFKRLNDGAHEWMVERIPAIRVLAEDIVRYGTQVKNIYQCLRDLIHDLADLPEDSDDTERGRILNDIAAHVGILCQEAQEHASHVARAADGSARLVAGLRQTSTDLHALYDSVHSILTVKSEELEQINREIKAMNDRMNDLCRSINIHRERAAKNAKLALIPFAGVGFSVAAIVEANTANRLVKEAKDLMRRFEKAKRKNSHRAAVYAALAVLEATEGWLASIDKDLSRVLSILGRVRGIWDAVAADLLTVPATLRRITMDPDPRPILMEMSLDVAVDEWSALAEKAQALSVEIFQPIAS